MLNKIKSPDVRGEKIVMLIIILAAYLLSCNTTEPPPSGEKPVLTLKLEDASCTEAWIELSIDNFQLPIAVTLKQSSKDEDVKQSTINLSTADTLLFIDSLLPNTSYKYQASSIVNPVSSNELNITTLDTTSHSFTFETFTFGGQAGSCALNDVAIIDENNIWAVGEIYLLDSLGQPDPHAYNAVHWDGNEWKLIRLQFYTFCGQPSTGSYPTKSIIAFDKNDIWITSGSQITHFDGEKQLSTDCIPVSVNKLWGTDDNNIYAVGVNGGIAHYQNGLWEKIESGTDLRFLDIYGVKDSETGKQQILVVASNGFTKKLFEIQGNVVTILSDNELANDLEGIWFVPNKKYYVVGAGIHYKHLLADEEWNHYPPGVVTSYLSGGVRGSDINNVFVTGSFFEIVHFNGISWHNYSDVIPFNSNGAVSRLDVKGNLFVTVGRSGAYAVAIIGKQN